VTRNSHNCFLSSRRQWTIKKQANTTKIKCKCAYFSSWKNCCDAN